MKFKVFLFIVFILRISFAQEFSIERIEPPNWWVGMKHDTVQVMIYGKNLSDIEIYPLVFIKLKVQIIFLLI
ncbi:MAG: cyclomaltodextrinase N-terminal domain-containing protein [Ignavibacterium sp.]|nr:cyclomaltodextrinase N-terminal domain-containing protein [Ignavibacterium sp.]